MCLHTQQKHCLSALLFLSTIRPPCFLLLEWIPNPSMKLHDCLINVVRVVEPVQPIDCCAQLLKNCFVKNIFVVNQLSKNLKIHFPEKVADFH